MDRDTMARLVREWDDAVVGASDALDWWRVHHREPQASVLHAPAEPAAIADLEHRIGQPLPPSFRHFLEITDGADAARETVSRPADGLLSTDRIDWFIRIDPWMPHLRSMVAPEGWSEPDNDERDGEVTGLVTRFLDGGAATMHGHLPHCLKVGRDDSSAVLLNPLVRDADGEWECAVFDTHDLAMAYRSFADFLASRPALVRGYAAAVERVDDAGLDDVDDATIERWLASRSVAPPWFWAQLHSVRPPPRAIHVLGRLIDARSSDEAVRQAARMQGAAALQLAQRAWTAAERESTARRLSSRKDPALPMTPALLDVATSLSGAKDPVVRSWLVDTLESHLRADPDFERLRSDPQLAAKLTFLSGAVMEQLWHRSGSDALLSQLVHTHQWVSVEDRPRAIEAVARRLSDPLWRAQHRQHVAAALEVVASGGPAMRPLLVALRSADGIRLPDLARALLRVGDDDLDHAARHVTIGKVDWLPDVPEEIRKEHRRRRATLARTEPDAISGGPKDVLDDLAGHHDPEATELVLGLRGALADIDLVLTLERQRTPAAADALAVLGTVEPHAWRSLARVGDARAGPPLMALLDHGAPEAQRFAVRGLRELDRRTATEQLVARVERTSDIEVVALAAHAAMMQDVDATVLLDRLTALGGEPARLAAYWRAASGGVVGR